MFNRRFVFDLYHLKDRQAREILRHARHHQRYHSRKNNRLNLCVARFIDDKIIKHFCREENFVVDNNDDDDNNNWLLDDLFGISGDDLWRRIAKLDSIAGLQGNTVWPVQSEISAAQIERRHRSGTGAVDVLLDDDEDDDIEPTPPLPQNEEALVVDGGAGEDALPSRVFCWPRSTEEEKKKSYTIITDNNFQMIIN